jgi:hypothetical protein
MDTLVGPAIHIVKTGSEWEAPCLPVQAGSLACLLLVGGPAGEGGWLAKENFLSFLIVHGNSCLCTFR